MHLFGQLFNHQKKNDDLLLAIERAVNRVDPLLRQLGDYPNLYLKPVSHALTYVRKLAGSLPGPVILNRETYAGNAFVHAIFPSVDFVDEAFCSSQALQDYYAAYPDANELYALMGMRRVEKQISGMELSGDVLQSDVIKKVVYFSNHTIENPALTEEKAREQVAWSFFDNLTDKVKKRIEERKQLMQSQIQNKNALIAQLRAANAQARPALEHALSCQLSVMQSTASSLDLTHYAGDFNAVMLHPEQYLKLNRTTVMLDNMGMEQANNHTDNPNPVVFNELINYDRRNWTVAMVYCKKRQTESFTNRLDKAYRRLTF